MTAWHARDSPFIYIQDVGAAAAWLRVARRQDFAYIGRSSDAIDAHFVDADVAVRLRCYAVIIRRF